MPALGAGLGGLSWDDVEPLIRARLGGLVDVRVVLHAPFAPARPGRVGPKVRRPFIDVVA